MLMRKLLAALLLFLPLMSQANPYPVQRAPAGLAEPAQVLRSGIEMLTGYLDHAPGASPAQIQGYLDEKIAPYFDFERMAYWTAGSFSRVLDPAQRAQLREVLKRRFLTAMAEQLSRYRHSRLQYMRPKGNIYRGDVTLGVRVFSRNQPPVQLEFRLHQVRDGWKVYDVVANGMSAMSYYRKEFSGIARRYGVQGLMARLGQ